MVEERFSQQQEEEEEEEEEQERRRMIRRRHVRFDDTLIRFYQSDRTSDEIVDSWCTQEELQAMKQERKQFVRELKKVDFDVQLLKAMYIRQHNQQASSMEDVDDYCCFRGYESYFSIAINRAIKQHRSLVIRTVLSEQQRFKAILKQQPQQQPQEMHEGLLQQMLYEISTEASQWAKQRAMELGIQDARDCLLYLCQHMEDSADFGSEDDDFFNMKCNNSDDDDDDDGDGDGLDYPAADDISTVASTLPSSASSSYSEPSVRGRCEDDAPLMPHNTTFVEEEDTYTLTSRASSTTELLYGRTRGSDCAPPMMPLSVSSTRGQDDAIGILSEPTPSSSFCVHHHRQPSTGTVRN